MTVGTTAGLSRKQLVAAAVERWSKDLVDTGKRNPLLYYRSLQAGTLSLDHSDPDALRNFLEGRATRLSVLFPTQTGAADALKRMKTIRKKVVTLEEERGIQTGYLAIGLATWAEEGTAATERAPAAPVLSGRSRSSRGVPQRGTSISRSPRRRSTTLSCSTT